MSNKSHPLKEEDNKQLPTRLFIINILFVVGNAASSIYRARNSDRWELGYIVFVYANLMAMIVCLRIHDRREGEGMKMAVCALMTVLSGTLTWGVAGVMEFGVVGQIVCAAVVVFAFTICSLSVLMPHNFCLSKEDDEENKVKDKKALSVSVG